MKRIAKIQIKLFQSDTYRAMLAKYGAPGALLIVRLQVMQQEGPLPDFTDERQLLIMAAEIGSTAPTVAEMLATLQEWTGKDVQPVRPAQTVDNQPTHEPCVPAAALESAPESAPEKPTPPKSLINPKNFTPPKQKQLRRKLARKERRQVRQRLRALKRDLQDGL